MTYRLIQLIRQIQNLDLLTENQIKKLQTTYDKLSPTEKEAFLHYLAHIVFESSKVSDLRCV